MGTIILIILTISVIGGIIGFIFSGGKKEETVTGAVAGAIGATGCLFRLILLAIPVFIGLWLLKLIF